MNVRVTFGKTLAWMCAYLIFAAGLIVVAASPAQESSRRVVERATPAYPALAKKMHLSGKVKIEVEINPAGSVTTAKMVGGNPIFETSAIAAVKQWKFEPAPTATKGIVTLEFAAQ